MDIKIKQEGDPSAAMQKGLDFYKKGLSLQMWRALTILKASVQQNIRRRSGLKVRTGNLLNSIVTSVIMEEGILKGVIESQNVPYAAVHEYGHDFAARWVAPRHMKALRWVSEGKAFFSKGHMIGAYRVPARPYMRPALEENIDRIKEKFGLFLEASFTQGA